jgi:hypothetical protein
MTLLLAVWKFLKSPVGRDIAIVVIVSALLIWWILQYGDYRYEAGKAAQAKEQLESNARQKAIDDKETARLQALADAAKKGYEDAQKSLNDWMATQQLHGSQLCKPPPASDQRPPAASQAAGIEGAGHAPVVVPAVPAADHGLTSDRFVLLKALGALCQHENDKLAEYEGR